jgi:hypothetical protein
MVGALLHNHTDGAAKSQGGAAEAISCVKVWSQGLANRLGIHFFRLEIEVLVLGTTTEVSPP